MMESYDNLIKKWSPVLNEESAGKISDPHRRAVTAAVLENTEKALHEQHSQQNFLAETPANNTSVASNWDPVLISLVRRAMPNMIAYDICGVQPMSGPTGLIFAMKSRYRTTKAGVGSGDEALFNEAAVGFTGDSSVTGNGTSGPSGLFGLTDSNADSSLDNDRVGPNLPDLYSTAEAEALGVAERGTRDAHFARGGATDRDVTSQVGATVHGVFPPLTSSVTSYKQNAYLGLRQLARDLT